MKCQVLFSVLLDTNVLKMMKMSFYIIYSNDDLFQIKKLYRRYKKKKKLIDKSANHL